jgi:hypothetical protein
MQIMIHRQTKCNSHSTATIEDPSNPPTVLSVSNSCLCRLYCLPHTIAALLLENHDLKAVKVRERPACFNLCTLLRPVRLLPFCDNFLLLDKLFYNSGAGSSWELRDDQRCESEVTIRERLTGNASCWAIDDGLKKKLTREKVP